MNEIYDGKSWSKEHAVLRQTHYGVPSFFTCLWDVQSVTHLSSRARGKPVLHSDLTGRARLKRGRGFLPQKTRGRKKTRLSRFGLALICRRGQLLGVSRKVHPRADNQSESTSAIRIAGS